MRGKVIVDPVAETTSRITPAYAGKRLYHSVVLLSVQDHPRLCGEKSAFPALSTASGGSPPPMRGKVCFIPDVVVPDRITPAYAGKSNASAIASSVM